MQPTEEQVAIVDAAACVKRLVVKAGAGTGKTATLELVAKKIRKPTIYTAYNTAIVKEAAGRFPSHVECRTAHSLAFGAVGHRYRGRLGGARQTGQRAASVLSTHWVDLGGDARISPAQLARVAVATVGRFCNSADDEIFARHVPRQNGLSRSEHDALALSVLPFARRAWSDICDPEGRLRFEHDHYLKMWALTRPLLPADVVMLDEAQDSNPVVARLVQDQVSAQQIACGDSNQSMYEWRGAVDALDRWNADEVLYLSQSWRFGQVIADEANKWLARLDTPLRLTGNPRLASRLADLELPAAILCRTNGEAMKQVMNLLTEGRKVALVGRSRDMINLAQAAAELKSEGRTGHPELYVFTSWGALQDYVENEPDGRDLKPFVDLVDAHGTDAIIDSLEALVPEDKAQTTVSTAHKSKGRQWKTVSIADDFPGDGEQRGSEDTSKADSMVAYVAVTRAQLLLDRGSLAWIDQGAVDSGTTKNGGTHD
ncbi:DNA helicase [Mycobacteroides chelonae]|uniref:DNA helicase n=2 Tax=Mycobacteroides chelonae TaxID=1774 RepID=A0A1S1LDG9_MYCCH|nr:DNA helicase [Mycobacteroides chelonae]